MSFRICGIDGETIRKLNFVPFHKDEIMIIRRFNPEDAPAVNALALKAFEQFQTAYTDWPGFRAKIAEMSSLATTGELIVAEIDGLVVGAVAYIGPGKPKADFFQIDWPIMRMLVVDPEFRGRGIGRALAEECLRFAERDGAQVFALHTSEIMQVALPMYQRMGFKKILDAPTINGVAYGVYIKNIG